MEMVKRASARDRSVDTHSQSVQIRVSLGIVLCRHPCKDDMDGPTSRQFYYGRQVARLAKDRIIYCTGSLLVSEIPTGHSNPVGLTDSRAELYVVQEA